MPAAASCSFADVAAAVAAAAAARNTTVTVPAGSADWGANTLTLTQGIKLVGAGRGSSLITGSDVFVDIIPDGTAVANDEEIRVYGFGFDGQGAANIGIRVAGTGPSATKPFNNLAIGNNRFKNLNSASGGTTSGIYSNGQVRGVIWLNDFDRCPRTLYVGGNNSVTEFNNGNFPYAYSSSDNLFFERNTIGFSSAYDSNAPGYMETGQGGRVCVRYNTWDFLNATSGGFATPVEWCDVHGFQNWTAGAGDNGQTGTMIAEYYGNTILNYSGNHLITHRGGWGLFHNNIISLAGGHGPAYIVIWDDQGSNVAFVDGIAGGIDTRAYNTYCFNNTIDGVEDPMLHNEPYGTPGTPTTIENREFYNLNTSFDGSAGIGRGTMTPTMSATNGVAYWKNATPTPSVDPAIVGAGHLYKRVGGAWVDYAQPYVYPHPLTLEATVLPALIILR